MTERKGLKYHREASGATLAEMGKVIGVSPSHYRKMEIGQSVLSLERAAVLAEILGCTMEDLL